jgi:membrane protease YdiL (CAAX protease family)
MTMPEMHNAEGSIEANQVNTRISSGRAMVEILFLGFTLVVYILILQLVGPGDSLLSFWCRMSVPNIWLLGMALLWLRRHPREPSYLGKAKWSRWLSGILAFLIILLIILSLIAPGGYAIEILSLNLQSLFLIILVPFAEEFYFRGLLLDHLVRNVGRIPAVILVSGLFGFLHLLQGLFWPMAILSVFLCILALVRRDLLGAIALHSGWNAFAIVIDLYRNTFVWLIGSIAILFIMVLLHKAIRTRRMSNVVER